MTEKKFCFIPAETKVIRIFNINNNSLQNYETITNTLPDVTIDYCIDSSDKIRYFFLSGKDSEYAENDEVYLKLESLKVVKNLFNINEIAEFNLILDDNPRVEFTVFYTVQGIHCKKENLIAWNENEDIVAYTYTLNLYKRYNL